MTDGDFDLESFFFFFVSLIIENLLFAFKSKGFSAIN